MSVYTTRVDDLWGPSKVMTAPNVVTRQDPVYKQTELRYPMMAEPVPVRPAVHYNPAPMLTMATAVTTDPTTPSTLTLPTSVSAMPWVVWLVLALTVILAGVCWHLKTRVDGLELMVQYLMFHAEKRF